MCYKFLISGLILTYKKELKLMFNGKHEAYEYNL